MERKDTGMVSHILVPTDMGELGTAALRWAAMLHDRLGSRVTVMYSKAPYVATDVIAAPVWVQAPDPEGKARTEESLRHFIREAVPQHADAFEILVTEEMPTFAINDAAKALDADLILMGTHARKGWRRALIGSITESVIHNATRNVLSLPPNVTDNPGITRILCPVNLSLIGRQALQEASSLASALGAELIVIHVAGYKGAPFLEQDFTAWIDSEVRERCSYAQVVAASNEAEEVLRMAQAMEVDLIVVGAQHKLFFDTTIIGATTERVVRFSPVPVWTVRTRSTADREVPLRHEADTVAVL